MKWQLTRRIDKLLRGEAGERQRGEEREGERESRDCNVASMEVSAYR